MRYSTCCCAVVLPLVLFLNGPQPSWTQSQSPELFASQLDAQRLQLMEASRLNQ